VPPAVTAQPASAPSEGAVAPTPQSRAQARELVDLALKAHGGQELLSSFKWFRWTGVRKSGPFTTSFKKTIGLPNRVFTDSVTRTSTGHIYTSKTSLIGTRAFKRSTGDVEDGSPLVQLDDEAVAKLQRNLRHEPDLLLINVSNSAAEVAIAPDQEIDGKTMTCVHVVEAVDDAIVLCFDKERHLLARIVDEKTNLITDLSHFENVSGAIISFRRLERTNDGTIETELSNVEAETESKGVPAL
jgi:hypothetical protein